MKTSNSTLKHFTLQLAKIMVISTILLTVATHSQPSFAGNSNSGGGNVCHIEGRATTTLLDLAYSNIIEKNIPDEPGIQFETSRVASTLGIDQFKEFDQLKDSVQLILEAWQSNSPGAITLLEMAINLPRMYVTPFEQSSSFYPFIDSSNLCKDRSVVAASVFFNGQLDFADGSKNVGGMLISINQLNRLDKVSQKYLIIHEGARALKVLTKATDAQLQDLVKVIASEDPNTYDLEAHPFFGSVFETYRNLKNFCKELNLQTAEEKLKYVCRNDVIKESLFSKNSESYNQYFDSILDITQQGYGLSDTQLNALQIIKSQLIVDSYRLNVLTLMLRGSTTAISEGFKGKNVFQSIENHLNKNNKFNPNLELFRAKFKEAVESGKLIQDLM